MYFTSVSIEVIHRVFRAFRAFWFDQGQVIQAFGSNPTDCHCMGFKSAAICCGLSGVGDPVQPGPAMTALERFSKKYEISSSGCWEWTASKSPKGYGQFGIRTNISVRAHRWAYEYFVNGL